LLARLAIESLEPTISFDVLLGGGYRLTSRTLTIVALEAYDAAIQDAIARTLRRVGIAYAPHDYSAAAQAMGEALCQDALLQSDLSAAEIELVRPTVRIQPDRQMIVAAQNTTLALPGPVSPDRTRRGPPLLSGPTDLVDEPTDAPSWAVLGAMFGREAPQALPAAADPVVSPTTAETIIDVQPAKEAASPTSMAAADVDTHGDLTSHGESAAEATRSESDSTNIVPWEVFAAMPDMQTDHAGHTPIAKIDTMQPNEPPFDSKRIARWIKLLQADDPALFKLWSMELTAQPAVLPTILATLTSDPTAIDASDDPHYQRALVEALAALSERPSHTQAAKTPERTIDDEPPNWLSLRQMGQEEVRDD
jgi:hypothetical protein